MFHTKALPPDAGEWKCSDLDGLWLHCFCGNNRCHHYAAHQLCTIIARRPSCGPLRLNQLMRKLRCARCRDVPARVLLVRGDVLPSAPNSRRDWAVVTRDVVPLRGGT